MPIIGGLLYLVLGRPLGGPKSRGGKSRVVAPDDDPAFLRDLSSKLEPKDEEAKDQKDQDPESDSKDKS